MEISLSKWTRIYYYKVTESIAFYPAIIAVGFLFLSWLMISFDFSDAGKELKSGLSWLSLKDATTARSIISTVAGAVISLTVFSFSMVMIVLNQAASQMSNRVLSSMIENRFQQIVLGFYIGTIVYALFLLTTIRDVDSGIYIPALSIYFLIFLTVIDIFLFIYFLEFVTQTVKYETIIDRVKDKALKSMKQHFIPVNAKTADWENLPYTAIAVEKSDYYQNFNEKKLLHIASTENLFISILFQQSSFLLEKTIFIKVYSNQSVSKEMIQHISSAIDFYSGQPIDINADYGFRQLAEIAIKALSPGINDPGTAIAAMHALSDLFFYRLNHGMPKIRMDTAGVQRIHTSVTSFEQLFEKCMYPIWDYGKKDRYIQSGLLNILEQLRVADSKEEYSEVFSKLASEIVIEQISKK